VGELVSCAELVLESEQASSFRVDKRAYAMPSVFELERDRIFRRCWLYAAHASELPRAGDFVTRTVGGRPLIIVRGRDGVVRAMFNTCTHRGSRVCNEAQGNARTFTCPYHAWSFDTTGALRGVPGRESYGPTFALSQLDLVPARTDTYRDFIFVAFSPRAGTLEDYLAGAKEYIDLVADQSLDGGMEIVPGTQHYGLRANWKLLAENSIDTYHVMALHRRYVEYLVQEGQMPVRPVGKARDLGNGHAVSETAPPLSCKPVAHWGPPMPESKRGDMAALYDRLVVAHGEERARMIGKTYRQLLVFPNLMLIDTCATTIRTWSPRDVQSMEVTAWALAPRDQSADERALTLQSFNLFFGPGGFATPDDIEMLEQCQSQFVNDDVRYIDCSRGIQRAEPSYDDDLPLRAFWRRWKQLMSEP
jgi:p-cumate 2,3-dioxygenase subunit alpha